MPLPHTYYEMVGYICPLCGLRNNYGLMKVDPYSFFSQIDMGKGYCSFNRTFKELDVPMHNIYQGRSNGSILFYKRKQLSISFKGQH